MTYLVWLVPIALAMGGIGLLSFLWSMRSGQYEDLDGAAERVLNLAEDRPLPRPSANGSGPLSTAAESSNEKTR
jgi:cbb3-type cytochrome oxidase maturation protein